MTTYYKPYSIVLKKLILVAILFFISILNYSCSKEQNSPLTEGTFVSENGVPWNAAITNIVKNDSITFYGKTEYDAVKLKFALRDISDHVGVELKNYQVDYSLVSPGVAVYKPDPVFPNSFRAYSFNETSTHSTWLQVEFSFLFKNITPATTFSTSNLYGALRIKMP